MVLDASALLAFLHNEPGTQQVESVLSNSFISAVNWMEVVQKALTQRVNVYGMREELNECGLRFLPFTPEQAEIAAQLITVTKPYGLSLGDRACLALAIDIKQQVMTADRIWKQLDIGIKINLIR